MNGHGSRLVGRRDFLAWESQRGLLLGVTMSEAEVHAARDAGELEEFRGGPDSKGARFTVNCQVPVLAPNTFTP